MSKLSYTMRKALSSPSSPLPGIVLTVFTPDTIATWA